MDTNHDTYKDHPVYKRLMASGPKRILSLDGGGIRGALTLGYLEEMESLLRDRYDKPDFVLSDYFDLVGGTSTGAIIATFIALGKPVEEIKNLYLTLGAKIFTNRSHLLNWWYFRYFLSAQYDHTILENELENLPEIKDLTLGSKEFKTGLAIFAKRADTYSTFVFHNHPSNSYYEYNKGIYIKDLLRATSAAPSYFKPKEIIFDDGESAVFIDGGVSMANNPSLMLFLMATIKGYGYQWAKSKDHMLMISVGTGFHTSKVQKKEKDKLLRRKSIGWAPALPDMFMKDATEQNKYLMQYFSNARIPEKINDEAGDLSADLISEAPLLDYCRYNVSLDKVTLAALKFHLKEEELRSLPKMDKGKNAQRLYDIGKAHALEKVRAAHYPLTFDFGIKEPTQEPISQEETRKLFEPAFKDEGKQHRKVKGVLARKAVSNEEVVSITSAGIETTNQAKKGDYIVKNQTEAKELYVVEPEKFHARYELFNRLPDGDWAEYTPKGKVYAFQLTEELLESLGLAKHFYIVASWEESQYVSIGDYMANPVGEEGVYRIGGKEFRETYKIDVE